MSFFQKKSKNQNSHVDILGRSQFKVEIIMSACAKFQFDTKNSYARYFKAK